ncbi:hypothetical protein Tco_0774428 [Tanacetum coccineum]|uniref:Uncharacterized protein n=1 Tax=Tanacetum coccineum TaxID=301880 RepID=A0ABQ4ZRK5_9ASTR
MGSMSGGAVRVAGEGASPIGVMGGTVAGVGVLLEGGLGELGNVSAEERGNSLTWVGHPNTPRDTGQQSTERQLLCRFLYHYSHTSVKSSRLGSIDDPVDKQQTDIEVIYAVLQELYSAVHTPLRSTRAESLSARASTRDDRQVRDSDFPSRLNTAFCNDQLIWRNSRQYLEGTLHSHALMYPRKELRLLGFRVDSSLLTLDNLYRIGQIRARCGMSSVMSRYDPQAVRSLSHTPVPSELTYAWSYDAVVLTVIDVTIANTLTLTAS